MSDPFSPLGPHDLRVLRAMVEESEGFPQDAEARLLVRRLLSTAESLMVSEENWRRLVARRAGLQKGTTSWVDVLDALDKRLDAGNDALDQNTEQAWAERIALETKHLHEENADLRTEVARLRRQRGVLADVLLQAEARVAQLLDRKQS